MLKVVLLHNLIGTFLREQPIASGLLMEHQALHVRLKETSSSNTETSLHHQQCAWHTFSAGKKSYPILWETTLRYKHCRVCFLLRMIFFFPSDYMFLYMESK